MSHWCTGVTVVTTHGGGEPYGLTVSSFASVSLNPLLVLVCLDNHLSGLEYFRESNKFGISILSDGQEDTSRLFARKGTERPADLYFTGTTGVPLIHGALAYLECTTEAMHAAGDHTIFVGAVQHLDVLEGKQGTQPLLYFRGGYKKIGG
jgi:3-hydroxy-9,10-secoandrosta-1,3,5(10)-triene-9,17-dione monooxygenase reductase component